MNTIQTFKTPSGDEMVVLPRADYDRLVAAAEDAIDAATAKKIMARISSGEEEVFPLEVVKRLAEEAESPIKIFREYRGLSQADLASKIGASAIYISQIETGRRTGSAKVLRKIANALNIDLDDLVSSAV